MRKINFDKIKATDLIEITELQNAFKAHMMKEFGYDEFEADLIISMDFENPYETIYVLQEHIQNINVDATEYKVYRCWTDFSICGMFSLMDKKQFEFYMLIDASDVKNSTVGEYAKARKLYIV